MTSKTSLLRMLAPLALALTAASQTQAAVVVTLPTPTVDGSLVITNDISFTITAGGSAQIIIFDEWVASDGFRNDLPGSAIAQPISYTVNGGPVATIAFHPVSGLVDNLAGTVNAVTDNDGFVAFGAGITVVAGDVFTLKAASYTIPAGTLPAGFNPQAQQTFSGNIFLTDTVGAALSALTPVPEPGTAVLGALAGLTLLRRRR